MTFAQILASLAAAVAAVGAHAQSAPSASPEHANHHPAVTVPLADAEVRKIDREQGKVTLRHGPIPNLDMPNMTMVFRVADATFLDTLKEGDKVKFTADKVNGAFTITSIRSVN